jgi:hypothetical protein
VKLGFLGLHAVNELPECLVGLLVGYASDKASVVSDLLVELGTLNHTWPFPKLARTCLRLANPSATQLFIEADPTNEKSAREAGWDRQPGRQVFFRPKLAGSCWRAFAMRLKRRDLARTVPELHRVSVYNSLSRAFALSSSPQVRSMRSIMWPSGVEQVRSVAVHCGRPQQALVWNISRDGTDGKEPERPGFASFSVSWRKFPTDP